ncbi:MAG: hypothetical protein KDD42_02295 [Bdellovibrionales bacterium]|nr:hypothetical protein [Bdellovibrionales bacterium]
MKRKLWLRITAGSLALCAIVAVSIAPLLGSYLEQNIIAALNRSTALRIAFEGVDTGLNHLTANKAKFFIPKILTVIEVNELDSHLSLLSLLKLNPSFEATGKFYGGKLELNGTNHALQGEWQLKAKASQVSIAKHAFFGALGITTGRLDFDLQDLWLGDAGVSKAETRINLSEFALPKDFLSNLDLITPGLNLGPAAQLAPEISKIELQTEASLENDVLKISSLSSNSSLGKVDGSGILVLGKTKAIEQVDLTLETDLKKDGALLLNLARNAPGVSVKHSGRQAPEASYPKWRVTLKGKLPPKISFEQLT